MAAFLPWLRGLVPARVWIALLVVAIVALSLARVAGLVYSAAFEAGYARRDADYAAALEMKNAELDGLKAYLATKDVEDEVTVAAAVRAALANTALTGCQTAPPEHIKRLNAIR